ncbi:hypothetical protein SCUP515_11248 [Seiridium cupressi]
MDVSQKEPASSRAPSRTSTTGSHEHRYHHTHCGSSNTPTQQPSSFLQERIQQRRAEKKMSEGNLSSSTSYTREGDNVARHSPMRRSTAAMTQQARSNGDESEINTMGIKEIEKTIETLKKQNWDLKLELYHRRERQSALEEQAKKVEDQAQNLLREHAEMTTQRNDTMRLNDDLARELDRRDKALFEAIDMIVDLQAKMAELEHEQGMARIIEADMNSSSGQTQVNGLAQAAAWVANVANTPSLPAAADLPGRLGDQKTLERMSSFLSERGERTVNLREVLLNNKSSLLHVRKISEASAVPSEMNRFASPSVSVLSESSFMSVYGNNEKTPDPMPSPPELEDPVVPNTTQRPELDQKPSHESVDSWRNGNTARSMSRQASKGGVSLTTQIHSLDNFLDVTSPLQQIEKLERKLSAGSGSRPPTANQGRLAHYPPLGRARSQVKTKEEKREALRKVVTSSPNANDFANARMLPPTPDTTSSSMLRRYQNSDDTLSREPRMTPHGSFVNDAHTSPGAALPPKLSSKQARGNFFHLAPVPVVVGRRGPLDPTLGADAFANFNEHSPMPPQRPRSADETTISRRRANSWGSDSDSEGGADAHSEASDLDYWMRESTKPDNQTTGTRGRTPDFFSFPAESGRWETDAIFGAMRGIGFMGSPAPNLRRDPMDEASSAWVEPKNGIYYVLDPEARDGGIDAPARRSSRGARTGSMSGGSIRPEGSKLRKSLPQRNSSTRVTGRGRSSSIDSANVRPQVDAPLDYQTDGASAAKRSQYPPIAGQPTRQKKSNALNRLFRRSIGGNQDIQDRPATAIATPAEQYSPAGQAQPVHPRARRDIPSGRSSVPPPATMPWRPPPAMFDDDLTSATPPPIMRNRASPTKPGTSRDEDGPLAPHLAEMSQQEPVEVQSANNTPQTGRRKWLGLGRRSSLMNRNA